jgi:hypothetical protein
VISTCLLTHNSYKNHWTGFFFERKLKRLFVTCAQQGKSEVSILTQENLSGSKLQACEKTHYFALKYVS